MAVFVGRSTELGVLESCFQTATGGRLQIVAIEGDSGIGKTRLIEELRKRLSENVGIRFCIGHCLEYVRSPYLPFAEVFAALGLRLPDQGSSSGERDADAKLQYFMRVADALVKYSTKRTLVIVIEDAHWADDATFELVQYLALRLREARVLLLLTHRSDSPQAASATGSLLMRLLRMGAKHLQLQSLGHDDVYALATSLARQKPLPSEFLSQVEAVADGNPLFIEELVRTARDRSSGDLKASLEIPLTIKAMLSERMLSLSNRERDVLMQAAVIGRNFDVDFLCDLCGRSREQVLSALQHACDLQLVVQDTDRAPRYSFRHALLRETLYQGILADIAGPLHARVAARMESNPHMGNALAELAYHWTAARIEDKAIEYNERAGDAAASVFAFSDAVRFYRQALRFPYPAGPRRAQLYERLALALRSAEGGEECQLWLDRAYQDYQRLGDVESMVGVLLHLAMQRWLDCNTEGSVECVTQAINLVHDRPHSDLLLKARLYKAAFCSTLGRVEEARAVLLSVDAMETPRDDESNALLYEVRAEIDAALDFGDQAFESLTLAADFANRSQNSDMTSFVENMFVITSSLVGGVDAAHAHFERAISAARKNGLGWREAHAFVHYADVLMFSGELERAREVLNRGLALPVSSSTIRACATFAGIPLASMLEDDALAESLSDDALIEGTFRSQEPQRIALMAAAFAELYAGRGEVGRARALLIRALRAIKQFHFSWRLAAQVSLLCEAGVLDDLNALLASAPPIRQPMSAAYQSFVSAVLTSRFESIEKGIPLALQSAEQFAAIGCRVYEARALEVGQRPGDALAIYEQIGSRRDVRRLRGEPQAKDRARVGGDGRVLTARQREVAALVAQGASNREIAAWLTISENTVEHHVTEILSRLGVTSRSQLAARLLNAAIPEIR